jgi:Tfp pilus assembly protein PilO
VLTRKKAVIQWAIGALLVIDLVLAGLNWRLTSAPRTPRTELALLRRQHALLAADVARAEQIRKNMPATDHECDTFFTQNLRPAGSGYSSLVSDLGAVAHDAGLSTENITFRQHTADKRGVVEVEIGASVDGDYPSVVRFINGLEHSGNFYVLDGLALAGSGSGSVGDMKLKLNLQLRTYFRS